MARTNVKVLDSLVAALVGCDEAFTCRITGNQFNRIKAAAEREGYKADEEGTYWIPTQPGADYYLRAVPIYDRGRYRYVIDAKQPNSKSTDSYAYTLWKLADAVADTKETPA